MMGLLVYGVQFMILLSDQQRRKLLENPNVEEITENDVTTGGEMVYKIFMDLLSEDAEKSNFYSNEFKKHIK